MEHLAEFCLKAGLQPSFICLTEGILSKILDAKDSNFF